MKLWTKRFLAGCAKSKGNAINSANTMKNAKRAQRKLHMSEKLYMELSREAQRLYSMNAMNLETAFAMGIIIGWQEHRRDVK